jgi:hypothetical protein
MWMTTYKKLFGFMRLENWRILLECLGDWQILMERIMH